MWARRRDMRWSFCKACRAATLEENVDQTRHTVVVALREKKQHGEATCSSWARRACDETSGSWARRACTVSLPSACC